MRELTVLEQIILVSIIRLKDEAYGMAIRNKTKSITGKALMYGTLYNVLDQLFRKGFIRKVNKKPMPHGRRYYAVTPSGNEALKSAYRLQKSLWRNAPETIREAK